MRLFLRLVNLFLIVQSKFCYGYSISAPAFNALDSMKHGVAAEFLERLSVFVTGNNHLWYQHFGLTIPHLSSFEASQGIERIHLKAKRVYSGDEKHEIYQFPPIPQQLLELIVDGFMELNFEQTIKNFSEPIDSNSIQIESVPDQEIICELTNNEQKQRYNGICHVAKKILKEILRLHNPGLKLRTSGSLESPELVLTLRVRRKIEIECQLENDYSSCVLDHFLLPTGFLPGIIAPKFVNMSFCRPRNMHSNQLSTFRETCLPAERHAVPILIMREGKPLPEIAHKLLYSMALPSAWPQAFDVQSRPNEPECQLTIIPEKLEFICVPVGKLIHLDVTVTNPTSEKQTYKVKCTSNEVFRVTPPYGILAPKESFKVRFYFQNKFIPDPIKIRHYFAIYHMKCPATTVQAKVRELWAGKETKPDGVKRFPVAFLDK